VIKYELSHLFVTGRTISRLLIVVQGDMMSRTLAWPIRPLHMHRWIIMSHKLVTEIKWKLTCSKLGTGIALQIDTLSPMPICHSFHPRGRSRHHVLLGIRFLYVNPLGTWYAGVNAYGFDRLPLVNQWLIGHCGRQEGRNVFARLQFPQT